MTETYIVKIGLLEFTIHLDNASHSSGEQRAYTCCHAAHHQPCHRYGVVKQWRTPEEGAATLALWALQAYEVADPKSWTKADHKKFHPDPARVASTISSVQKVVRLAS